VSRYYVSFRVADYWVQYHKEWPRYREVCSAVRAGAPVQAWLRTREDASSVAPPPESLYALASGGRLVVSYPDVAAHVTATNRKALLGVCVLWSIPAFGVYFVVQQWRRAGPIATSTPLPVQWLFSLTPLQRLVNPIERLFFVLLAFLPMIMGLVLTMTSDGPVDPWGVVACVGMSLFLGFLFRGRVRTFYAAIRGVFFNAVRIDRGAVLFGIGQPQLTSQACLFRVSKGFLGTVLLRHRLLDNVVIVIPSTTVSLNHLEEALATAQQEQAST